MKVVLSALAARDAHEENAWWRANRPDAPDLLDDEITAGVARLATDAASAAVFRRIGDTVVRRVHLTKTRRHLYFVVDADRVTVLAVWGCCRHCAPAPASRGEVPARASHYDEPTHETCSRPGLVSRWV